MGAQLVESFLHAGRAIVGLGVEFYCSRIRFVLSLQNAMTELVSVSSGFRVVRRCFSTIKHLLQSEFRANSNQQVTGYYKRRENRNCRMQKFRLKLYIFAIPVFVSRAAIPEFTF